MANEFPHWRGIERVDGMRVCKATVFYEDIPEEYADTWMVRPPDDRRDIVSCPCCVGMIHSKRAAMLLADKVYPVQGGSA